MPAVDLPSKPGFPAAPVFDDISAEILDAFRAIAGPKGLIEDRDLTMEEALALRRRRW